MSTSTHSHQQLLLWGLHNRRLLLSPPTANSIAPSSTEPYIAPTNGFDANVVMVLSVLLCALICSLGLNSIIRCALRCSALVENSSSTSNSSSSSSSSTARLANTGIKRKALKTFPTVNYSPDLKLPGLGSECVICLSEFSSGERLRLLPKCNHGFHVRCIDKWLNSHSSCPTCRHCLIETCQKIVGCSQASSAAPPVVLLPPPTLPPALPTLPPMLPTLPPVLPPVPPPQEVAIDVLPLDREEMMHNTR